MFELCEIGCSSTFSVWASIWCGAGSKIPSRESISPPDFGGMAVLSGVAKKMNGELGRMVSVVLLDLYGDEIFTGGKKRHLRCRGGAQGLRAWNTRTRT